MTALPIFRPEVFVALLLFAFASSITPGPNNTMLMASGANFGLKRSLPHWFGIIVGFSLLMLACEKIDDSTRRKLSLYYDECRET